MAKYLGRDGKKIGKIGREVYYEAFESNIVRERALNPISPNTKKNIITKAKFASTMKFTDYCLLDGLTKFFPDIKGAKMKRSSILKVNKNSFLPMHKQYYKRSSIMAFGNFRFPGNQESVLKADNLYLKVFGEDNWFHGLYIFYGCNPPSYTTIGSISEVFLNYYEEFQEGDIVHCFGTFCDNCYYHEEIDKPIIIDGNCNKRYIHRQFTLNKHDERYLYEVGFKSGYFVVDEDTQLTKIIIFPLCNEYKVFEADRPFDTNPGSLIFWIESKNGGIHNKGGALQINTRAYDRIVNYLSRNDVKESILKSWKVIDYPIAYQ